MEGYFKESMMLGASYCGSEGTLSYSGFFALIQDIAALHAKMLNCGGKTLSDKGLFWVIAKTKIQIMDRPHINDEIVLETWPEKQNMVRFNRDYRISFDNKVVALAKSEWIVLEKETNKIHFAKDVYPSDMSVHNEVTIEGNLYPIEDSFEGDYLGEHHVSSSDIDFSNHMNNVKYITAFENLYSTKDLSALNIKEIEINYKKQCRENDIIKFYFKKVDDVLLIKGVNSAMECAVLYKIK